MRIEFHHHYFTHAITQQEIDMAVSKAFQNELDRLTNLVGQENAATAIAVADAVRKQAEADAKAISDAQAAAQDATDELNALKATLDKLNAPPVGADSNPAPVAGNDTIGGGAAPDAVQEAPAPAVDGSNAPA